MTEELKVTEEELCGLRIDKYISDFRKIMTRSQLKQRNAVFLVDGKEVKYSHRISINENIKINFSDYIEMEILPEKIDLDIIYEDDNVIVINKSQGMVVHPADGNYSGTLVNGLLFYLKNHRKNFESEPVRPGIVHRLDKETSGVIIVAKNIETHEFLSRQFRERTTEKKYIAVVKGKISDKEGTIETFIARDSINRKKFTASKSVGKKAVTDYRVLKEFENFSVCMIKIRTGRTHQIRVHMSHIGHPVLGDPVYSRKDSIYPDATLMLHAYMLSINIPGRGEMQFTAPLPDRIKQLTGNKFII